MGCANPSSGSERRFDDGVGGLHQKQLPDLPGFGSRDSSE
jgi:hypothetical protein